MTKSKKKQVLIDQLAERRNETKDEQQRINYQGEINTLLGEQVQLQQKAKQLADSQSFTGSLSRGLVQLSDAWGNVSRNVADFALNGIRSAVQGVSDAIMGAITGTRTWGEVFAQVGQSIIANLINIVVQWIAQMTIIAALKRLLGTEDNTQAAESAAAWAPAAIAASIASYGAAALVGTASYAAALVAGTALTAGLSFGGSYAEGGTVRGPGTGTSDSIWARISNGEYIMPAARVTPAIYRILEGIRNGAIGAQDLAGAVAPRLGILPMPVQGGGGTGDVTVEGHTLSVGIMRSHTDMVDFWKSAKGRKLFIQLGREHRRDIGIGT